MGLCSDVAIRTSHAVDPEQRDGSPAASSHAGAAAERLSDVSMGVRLKVCGITQPAELDVLSAQSVDFVGLWYGVPGGPADLALADWQRLATEAAAQQLAAVLVTFVKDPEVLREALDSAPVCWVQLHGYQTPGLVRAIKRISPDIRVIKVLHVRGHDCVEEPLIGSYEKAGVDVFLFDAVSGDGRVGSTGESLDSGYVSSLAPARVEARSNASRMLVDDVASRGMGDSPHFR